MKGRTQTRLEALVIVLLALAFGLAPAGALAQKTAKTKTPPAMPAKKVIWHDPGTIEKLDFTGGPGGVAGAPKAPFTFVEEDLGGSNPKVKVKDASGVEWTAKFGEEVKGEVFSTRMIWAVGYFAETAYYVRSGTIAGVTKLKRASNAIAKDGSFNNARLEIKKEKGITKLKDEQGWSWLSNPFVGTKELNGLKIMLMLTSNWDNKDVRDISRGSNTAILVTPKEAQWLFTDWGATMGAWGGVMSRSKWNPRDYENQNKDFIKRVKDGIVEWGYSGQHSEEFTRGIPVAHVQWLMQYLGRITDAQISAGLVASGADPAEVKTYSAAVRNRINQLKNLK
jgi:hypothetical protein